MTVPPLKIYEKLDPELLKRVENSGEFVFNDGALPKKYKLLIAMAFDASFGAVQGVKSLARQAIEAGATKEEITEVLILKFRNILAANEHPESRASRVTPLEGVSEKG